MNHQILSPQSLLCKGGKIRLIIYLQEEICYGSCSLYSYLYLSIHALLLTKFVLWYRILQTTKILIILLLKLEQICNVAFPITHLNHLNHLNHLKHPPCPVLCAKGQGTLCLYQLCVIFVLWQANVCVLALSHWTEYIKPFRRKAKVLVTTGNLSHQASPCCLLQDSCYLQSAALLKKPEDEKHWIWERSVWAFGEAKKK